MTAHLLLDIDIHDKEQYDIFVAFDGLSQ